MLNPSVALLAWPLVAIWLFTRLPFRRAILWSVLGSYLFLPAAFAIDLPGVPPMDKESLPNLALLVIVCFAAPARFRLLPEDPVARLLLGLLFAGGFLTALTNQDPIRIADFTLPAMSLYDGLTYSVRQFLVIVPFLIGWQYLRSTEAHREILRMLLIAGLAYSVLMLFEVRMSPQLHAWVYGYFPHSFAQQVRGGGFRPVVFLTHGLWVAFFAMTVFIAAIALWRDSRQAAPKPRYLYMAGYLGAVLILCKSLGSILYGLALAPIVALTKTRRQIWIAAVLVLISLTYPILRGAQLVPTETILEWAGAIDVEREESLRFRFVNEDLLLAHAERRPLFGWGLWSRGRVFDAETGADISTTDGYWVIIIGIAGWAGYLAIFGLLGLPVLRMWLGMQRSGRSPPVVTGALGLLIAINMIDLLPNATLTPLTWLIAGALLGHSSQRETVDEAPAPEKAATVPRTVL